MESKIQVLIVDDDEKIGKVFTQVLKEEGVDAEYVCSGTDAIAQVKNKKYDLIFMDVIMPGLNGVETLKEIRTFNPDIPVVMITGYSVTEMLEKAKSYGIHSALNKPVNSSQMLEIINDVMKHKTDVNTQKTVIIVDPKSTAETLLFAVLEEAGFSIVVSNNGEELNNRQQALSYDLVLVNLDINENNDELVKRISSHVPKNKIVILTDTTEEEKLMEEAFKSGALKYISRSSSKDELIRLIGQR